MRVRAQNHRSGRRDPSTRGTHLNLAANELRADERAVACLTLRDEEQVTMGHIERRVWSGKVSYRARYRDPAGRERSKSFDRKADAERWLAQMEHAKARGL
jgi:hypothetical protein